MFMSLFFLKLSILTYFLGHFWAKRTLPSKHNSLTKSYTFAGSKEDFSKLIYSWVQKNTRLSIREATQNHFLINENPGLLSYGYFYHISLEKFGKNTKVHFAIQAKLIGSPMESQNFSKELIDELELKNVS